MSNKITLLCLCAVVALSLISAACSQATPSAPTNASPTETPPVVSRDVSPSETPPVDDPVAPSFATYTNVEYGFEFDYPAQVEVRVEEKPFQLLVYTESANPFYVRATRDFSPGDAAYFLDTSSTGELVYGPYVWLTYNLPDGYADATGVSQPIYALQMQAEDVLYSVVFYNQDSLTEVQGQILSTFRLLE